MESSRVSRVKPETGLRDTEGSDRPEKEADHSRLAGDRCGKQGNFNARLVLGSPEMSTSLHQPAGILKAYTLTDLKGVL